MANQGFMPSLYDPSIQVDQDEIQRRMQLADMLRKQSMAQQGGTQMAGNIAIKNSPLAGVAQLLQGYQADRMDQDNMAQRQALALKQAQALRGMADGFFGKDQAPNGGRPEGVSAQSLSQAGFPQPQADPKAEIMAKAKAAFLMGDQETARALMKNAYEMTPEMKNMAYKGIDPRAMGNAEMAKAQKEALMDVSPGNTVYNPATNQPMFTAKDKDPQGFRRDAQGNLQVEPGYLSAELALRNAGATRVQTNVASYLPASEEAQREFMKGTRATYDSLKQAPVALQNIEQAKALVPAAKGFMGPGGDSLLESAKFLNNRLGTNINTEGVKSAEELRTRIFFNIMDNLKKMDAQPSEMQQKMMSDALGKLGTDPAAMPRVLDAFGDVIRGKVQLHNQEVQGAVQRGVKFPYNPIINLQQQPMPGNKGLQQNPDGSFTYTPG